MFRYLAYAHIKQDKLEPRALRCIFIGYPDGVKGYKMWCLETGHKICFISRDVVIDETKMGQLINTEDRESLKLTIPDRLQFEVEPVELINVQNQGLDSEPDGVDRDEVVDHSYEENTKFDSPYSLAKDRPRRTIHPPQKYAQSRFDCFCIDCSRRIR